MGAAFQDLSLERLYAIQTLGGSANGTEEWLDDIVVG